MSVGPEASKSFCLVHDVYIRDRVEIHEDVAGGFLYEKVGFILADPRYNFRYKCNMDNS